MKYLSYLFFSSVFLFYSCDNSIETYSAFDYSIDQKMDCFCSQAGTWVRLFVKADTISYAIRISDNKTLDYKDYKSYKSVNELFDLIYGTDTNLYNMVFEIDVSNNFPSYIYINPKPIMYPDSVIAIVEDAQFAYTSKNYIKLRD